MRNAAAVIVLHEAERGVTECDECSALRLEWVPLLDSKRFVGTVLVLEGLLLFKVPPERVVRRGGYSSVDEAPGDMLDRINKIGVEKGKPKVRA